ncbi:MAG: DUF4434 domain-containing protein [Ruminococcus sp.]|nr:DUF4434 domain-containing protein [Ruminococcus sp.]
MKKKLSIMISAIICTAAVPADSHAAGSPWKFTSSFIQNWYCRDWTEERWEQEFTAAKSAGFDSLILQSTYDIVRGDCAGNKQDTAAYPSAESFCMFPSAISATYHSSQNSGDAIELALKAAKATDMQLWIGIVNDDMWWNYGWGAPSSYFEDWCGSNSELSSGLISEIWQRYGSDYGDQIAGWYYTNEIWNIDAACDGSDNGEYARIIGENINAAVTAINRACPGKPLIISPFFNTDISSPEQFGSFISDVIASSGLRDIDIYAPQEGGGREYPPEIIRKWAEEQKKAVDGRMHFWMNNECFGKERTAKPVEQLRENYNATADLAENNILFSWNHYYATDNALNSQFTAFSSETVSGDVNGDGELTVADIVLLQKWLLASPDAQLRNWQAADLCTDGRLDVFDMIQMRRALIDSQNVDNSIVVSNVEELRAAVKNAGAGDVIKVAPGEYLCGSQKLYSQAEGTAEKPIVLEALDKNDPPVLRGANTASGYILHITGDNWVVDGLKLTNSQKGIVLDNSNHTVIQNCEVCDIGAEAIAVRDGSSYCTVKSCYIHDTGLVSPGYGEGVYIGSSKEKTEFDFKCDHNKVIDCTFKNVAAEHVDVKEYTTGTEICGCTFYGDGMTGENYAGSFLDLKGNDCYVHDNVGYRNGNPKIVAAFEVHEQVEGWGYHHIFENNTLYMDQPYGAENTSRRMYVVDGWFSDFSVKNNLVDYGNGLVHADSWEFYNSDNVTYLE